MLELILSVAQVVSDKTSPHFKTVVPLGVLIVVCQYYVQQTLNDIHAFEQKCVLHSEFQHFTSQLRERNTQLVVPELIDSKL